MSITQYKEFQWQSADAGNLESGEGLAQVFLAEAKKLNVKRVCDLGCGNGYLSGLLAAEGYEVVGIDASQSGIGLAANRYPGVKFICSLIDESLSERLSLEPFDLVISSDVIEHLYSPASLVEAAASLLLPGGSFLIGTPYHGYWKNLLLALTGKMDAHFNVLDDGGHIKFFSVKTLSKLLLDHFFNDFRFTYYGRTSKLWMNMICHARRTAK